jgi:hypothetical protein
MADHVRKNRKNFTPDQRLEYAKLMVEEQYSNQQVMDLSGASPTAVSRLNLQLLTLPRNPSEICLYHSVSRAVFYQYDVSITKRFKKWMLRLVKSSCV